MVKVISSELLDTDLLRDTVTLDSITRCLRIFQRPNGWHYDLDLIWIIKMLLANNVLPGSTVLDAGAGMGILQFYLAFSGYNVISIDYSDRIFTRRMHDLLNFQYLDTPAPTTDLYTNSVRYTLSPGFSTLFSKLFQFSSYTKLFSRVNRLVTEQLAYKSVTENEMNGFGSITVVKSSFDSLPDNIDCDAIASLSVIEHCPPDCIPRYLNNLSKCLRTPDSPFLVTTSVNRFNRSIYNCHVKGFEFSLSDLEYLFNTSFDFTTKDLQKCALSLDVSSLFRQRLSLCSFDTLLFKDSTKNSLNVPYIPIGLLLSS